MSNASVQAASTYRAKKQGDVRAIVEVEAMRWDGSYESQSQIVTWGYPEVSGWFDGEYYLRVDGPSGEQRAVSGDWVIRSNGAYGALTPMEFANLYEAVE